MGSLKPMAVTMGMMGQAGGQYCFGGGTQKTLDLSKPHDITFKDHVLHSKMGHSQMLSGND